MIRSVGTVRLSGSAEGVELAADVGEDRVRSAVGVDLPPALSFTTLVEPDRLKTMKVFVRQPASAIKAPTQGFRFRIEDKAGLESAEYTATFNAPETAR